MPDRLREIVAGAEVLVSPQSLEAETMLAERARLTILASIGTARLSALARLASY